MDLVLVKYYEEFGRMGDLEGIFVCTRDELESLNGIDIYFGEVLGKHSEVYSNKTYENCEVQDITAEDLGVIVRVFGVGTISGYSPIENLPEDEEEYS